MDKGCIKKTLFKFFLANTIDSFIIYGIYFCFGQEYMFVFPMTWRVFILHVAIMAIISFITGFMFRFENRKETWIVCNVVAIFAGILMGINECFFDDELFTILIIILSPFIGIDMICESSIFAWNWLPNWLMIVLGVGIFICCQNLFLVPTLIKDRIQKRKISFRKPPEKVIERTSDEKET